MRSDNFWTGQILKNLITNEMMNTESGASIFV